MIVEIGGNRLGSGGKMTTSLDNYHRSTHNLTQSFKSTMACGTLVPFLVEPAQKGDVWEIDLDCLMRTLPTLGPVFGSAKVQLDIFQAPIRLYQGILHNNPTRIGMEMSKVLLPKVEIGTKFIANLNADRIARQIAPNSLVKYCGISGIGRAQNTAVDSNISRKFNAIPMLMYYDTFKCYYANKQENNAYIITPQVVYKNAQVSKVEVYSNGILTYESTNKIKCTGGNLVKIYGNGLNLSNITVDEDPITDYIRENRIGELDAKVTEYGIQFVADTTLGELPVSTVQGYPEADSDVRLTSFPLENIDQMRYDLLTSNAKNTQFTINRANAYYPYLAMVSYDSKGVTWNNYAMNGLCVKTYQADIFNNWLNSEWIDGDNGIAALTAVDTSNGNFTIDALNLAEKIYNVFNRVAISGGTYEDWEEAVTGEQSIRKAETPMYCGGMSTELVFEEVIAQSDSAIDGDINKTGSLAGKGTLNGRRGGQIHIKIHEASYIMGIVSITPRVEYHQGNAWHMTEINSMDDWHKPALDGIGFQDLMTEQACWWDVRLNGNVVTSRTAIGKVPAWMNYMTAVDKIYGDFADENKQMYMVFARNYEFDFDDNIADMTTYIDPKKYNYIFAYNEREAQNYWLQIYSRIRKRSIMSAKIIPTM